MAKETPYYLETGYLSDRPVESADLNRRALVINYQLPGALRAAGLCPGVFPLWSPDTALEADELVANLAEAAGTAFKVTLAGGFFEADAGAAVIEHPSGALVYTQSNGLSAARKATEDEGPQYIHLMLAQAADPLAVGAADTITGSPPVLRVSDLENEPGGLLLAAVVGGALQDRRRFTAPVHLAREFEILEARLDKLEEPIDPGSSNGPTAAQFLELQNSVKSQGERIAALEARLAALENQKDDDFPSYEDQLADEIAINRAGLAEVNPTAIKRGQISVVVANAGHGQFETPDYSPTTGAAGEMFLNPLTGVFEG